jgi:hypothetical protein
MDQHRREIRILCVLSLIGIAYSVLLDFQHTLSGKDTLDGAIGVVFGLYLSSHPAAGLVDLLFFKRAAWNQPSSHRSMCLWLVINVFVLLIGWLVIFVGTTRLIGRAD